jgi:hypothetical protein
MRRLLVVALAVMVVVSGCGLFGSKPTASDAANRYVAAFTTGDTTTAAAATDNKDAAKQLLDRVRTAVKPTATKAVVDQVRDGQDSATASITTTWTLDKGRTWSYPGTLELRKTGDNWLVHWAPSVVHPDLAPNQTIAVREQASDPAPVVDRDGAPVLSAAQVIAVQVDRAKTPDLNAVATSLANALSGRVAGLTAQDIVDGATKAPAGQAYTVATLRDQDYQQVKPQIYDLPGVRFTAQNRLIPQDKAFAPQFLPGIRDAAADTINGTPGWRVVLLDPSGTEAKVLHEEAAKPGSTVTTTLSTGIQQAAQNAVNSVPQHAVLVAIQPSTGEILAVAQNPQADADGPIAFTGRYPPGSTFKIITATAAQQTGVANPDTMLPCPGTTTIQGRVVPNENQFDLGVIPMHKAFAQSCNTTFSQLATQLPADGLTNTAKQLGIGVDFTMPGATTVTGSVPAASNVVERAEDGFGQGKVLVSPLGMALVAATVERGTLPAPVLIRGRDTTSDSTPEPVAGPALDGTRTMMREVVTSGTARAIAGLPGDIRGKTGTAEFNEDNKSAHGWFVGYRGDLAFAMLLVDGGSSLPAVQATGRFLQAVPG